MDSQFTSKPLTPIDSVDDDGSDLSVEPVNTITFGNSKADISSGYERLYRLRLRLRIAALEAALERSRRRRALIIEHYEKLLEHEDDHEPPHFSWR